jgi:hypothetical protein
VQGDTAGMRRLLGRARKKAAVALEAAQEAEGAAKAKARQLAEAEAKTKATADGIKKLPPGKRPFVRPKPASNA